jgi:coproporphyrinogen III oxidase-like Fe-S oxidoreductase
MELLHAIKDGGFEGKRVRSVYFGGGTPSKFFPELVYNPITDF